MSRINQADLFLFHHVDFMEIVEDALAFSLHSAATKNLYRGMISLFAQGLCKNNYTKDPIKLDCQIKKIFQRLC